MVSTEPSMVIKGIKGRSRKVRDRCQSLEKALIEMAYPGMNKAIDTRPITGQLAMSEGSTELSLMVVDAVSSNVQPSNRGDGTVLDVTGLEVRNELSHEPALEYGKNVRKALFQELKETTEEQKGLGIMDGLVPATEVNGASSEDMILDPMVTESNQLSEALESKVSDTDEVRQEVDLQVQIEESGNEGKGSVLMIKESATTKNHVEQVDTEKPVVAATRKKIGKGTVMLKGMD
ncbi:unnamed protein product [Arabis nemorensis]|uniref:Uncharacterized protein n=1 Tax=Arabis nemorensis TaxID=586526 RepID=A0A565BAJ4_9BRAS|nr:unnamed protein product [Arabis nemorensis]